MKKAELHRILRKHAEWLAERGGKRADLRRVRLSGMDLRAVNLNGADLREANLDEVDFQGANLRWANLREADLREADLREADIREADLREADLQKASLKRAYLREANLRGANFQGADLRGANLRGANLRGANLRWANLRWADLREADLREADLQEADLREADLRGTILTGDSLKWVDLRGAIMDVSHKYRTTNLYGLLDQPGKIRAYKLVDKKGEGPFYGGIKYEVGRTCSVDKWCDDEYSLCASGINLADLPWCLREWKPGYRILVAEFTAKDIVAIPVASDGMFRVKRCRIVGEKDLKELGLEETELEETAEKEVNR